MSITQDLILDASDAERTIADIDQQLQTAAELFKVGLADALSILEQPVVVDVGADIGGAQDAVAALADEPPIDIPVTVNTDDAEQQILGLEDQPPIDIPVAADTGEAEQQILALGDQPTVVMNVTADTADALAEIHNAQDEAETAVSMPVTADTSDATSGIDTLHSSVTGLEAAVGVTEGSAAGLLGVLKDTGPAGAAAATGVAAVAGATAEFFEKGLDAVSAGQRFDLILGDLRDRAQQVDVFGLNTDLEQLGITFGSTGADMENATAKLFQFAINSGASKDKALEFTQQIEGLSARAISLNPQLGNLADVTENLGVKIGRGGRFAAQYQLDLNAAEIATRALADTGKSSASDLTFMEKAIAGAEIAAEKYGGSVKQNVEDGSKNAAIQLASLKATFQEALEKIGTPLVAPVFDLIRAALPDAELIAQDLETLGADVLPVLTAALTAVGVPLRIIDDLFSGIPAPLLTAAAAFFLVEKAVAFIAGLPVVVSLATAALNAMTGAEISAGVAATSLEAAAAPLALIAATAFAVFSAFNAGGAEVDSVATAVDSAARSFDDLTVSVSDVIDKEIAAIRQNEDLASSMDRALVSADDLREALLKGGDGYDKLAAKIIVAAKAGDTSFESYIRQINELGHLKDATEAEAKIALDSAVSHGKLQDAQRQQAIEQAGLIDGSINYVAALALVQPGIAEVEQKEKDAADAAAKLTAGMQSLIDRAPAVVASMQAVTSGHANEAAALEFLAVSAGHAKLSEDELKAAAEQLGVSSDQLKGFIDGVNKSLDEFVSNAVKNLPSVSTAIDDALDPKAHENKPIIIDPKKLEAEIQDAIDKINGFNLEIAFLTQQGFDNLAEIAAQRGPEFTDALVKSIQKGGDQLGTELDSKFGELNDLTAAEGPKLRDAGGGIIIATGEVARAATDAFGNHFLLTPPTQEQLSAAKTIALQEQIPFSEALKQVAGDGATAYEQALGVIPNKTSVVFDDAKGAIDSASDPLGTKAQNAGGSVSSGFQAGMGTIPDKADQIISDTAPAISGAAFTLRAVAETEGFFIGKAFDDGIASGIDSYIAEIESSARAAVLRAEAAARRQADAHSPSRVFAEVGADFGRGIALGMRSSVADIMAASVEMSKAAELAVPTFGAGSRDTAVQVPGLGSFGETSIGSIFGNLTVEVQAAAGMTTAEVRDFGTEVGRGIVDGVSQRLSERQFAVEARTR